MGQNLRSPEVAEMLNSIALRRPLPQLLKTDNGSEFSGKMLDRWVYERGIRIDFSRREHRRIMRRWSPSRQVKAGMSERELVHVSGGCTVQNRGLAHTL